jgi:hypothetical protein
MADMLLQPVFFMKYVGIQTRGLNRKIMHTLDVSQTKVLGGIFEA